MYSPERRPHEPLLLPFAYLPHLGEDWFGAKGFALGVPGDSSPDERFLLINGVAWSPMLAGILLAVRSPALLGLTVSFATVLLVNGGAHLLGSLANSPGTVTGVLI